MISIIIPTFNRVQFLKICLESILNQKWRDWECIVIDDHSEDNTVLLLESFRNQDERIKYFRRPDHLPKGANTCRNFGFSFAKGKYVVWFDDDDLMLPGFLEKMLNGIEGKDVGICLGYYTNQDLERTGKMQLISNGNLFQNYVLWKSQIITNSVLFRKSFLNGKRLFDERLVRAQEAEFFSRIFYSIKPEEYTLILECLFLYRQHTGTKTETNKQYIPAFKESIRMVLSQNFSRSIRSKNAILINYLYAELLELFALGINNGHRINSVKILKKLIPGLWSYNKKLVLKLITYGSSALIRNQFNRDDYKRLKQNIIK